MHRIVVAMDSFKGSLSSREANEAVAAGLREVFPEAQIDCVPMADGGEGMTEALEASTTALRRRLTVKGPLGVEVEASYLYDSSAATAYIESAAACGLTLLNENDRNPMLTGSFGLGQLLRASAECGAGKIVIGLGGSATNDGGTGMLAALGWKFFNKNGDPLAHLCGGALSHISKTESPNVDLLKGIELTVACDVDNPMCGSHGATMVFAPQKGADPAQLEILEAGMQRLERIYSELSGKEVGQIPGGGAAGGLGAAFASLLGATMRRGADIVMDAARMDRRLEGATLVITGEGHSDRQTLGGKAPFAVMKRAANHGIDCILISGCVSNPEELAAAGFLRCIAARPADMPLAEAMNPAVARRNLMLAARSLAIDLA